MANAADDRWPEDALEPTSSPSQQDSGQPAPTSSKSAADSDHAHVEEAQAWGEAATWSSPRANAHSSDADGETSDKDGDKDNKVLPPNAISPQAETSANTATEASNDWGEAGFDDTGFDEADFDDEGFEDTSFDDTSSESDSVSAAHADTDDTDARADASVNEDVNANLGHDDSTGDAIDDGDMNDDAIDEDATDEDDDEGFNEQIAAAVGLDALDDTNNDAESPDEAPDDADAQGAPLEEIYYPAESSMERLEPNSVQLWGEQRLRIDAHLIGDWYRATALPQDLTLLISPQPRPQHWGKLPQHPVLPKVFYSGEEGYALHWTSGDTLALPLRLEQALDVILPLAQLVRFFEAQGLAVVDIEPQGLLRSAQGIRLRYPPQLMPIGEDLPKVYREGFTPPEIHEKLLTLVASGGEGVYVLAALLAYCLGIPVPAEGPDQLFFSRFRDPGVPQLLAATLTVPFKRLSPSAFVYALKALRPRSHPHFDIAARTTVGLNPSRRLNEDSYGYVQHIVESYQGKRQLLRVCVADGMGGAAAGERASQAAVATFCHNPTLEDFSPEAQSEWTLSLVWQANQAVLDALQGQDGGCTFTGVVLLDNVLTLAHVGDSRAYLHNAQGLQALSKDHSLVNALVASGMLSEEEAENSPDRNKVLRSLGSLRHEQDNYIDSLEAMLDIETLELALGDIVLLVSDGVWGEVKSARLGGIIERHLMQPQAIADALIEAALDTGAADNATVVVIRRSR